MLLEVAQFLATITNPAWLQSDTPVLSLATSLTFGDLAITFDGAINATDLTVALDPTLAPGGVMTGTGFFIYVTCTTSFTCRGFGATDPGAAVLIVIILAINVKRGPDVFFSTEGYGQGESLGYLGVFFIASLASLYVMYGFDTASSLGEETLEPRRTAPRAILRAILASFVIGGAILMFAVLAVPDLYIFTAIKKLPKAVLTEATEAGEDMLLFAAINNCGHCFT